jgi:hypothetical protein
MSLNDHHDSDNSPAGMSGTPSKPGTSDGSGAPTLDVTVDLNFTWEGALPALLAVITDGTSEGQSLARPQLQLMAAAADIGHEALSSLAMLAASGAITSSDMLGLLSKARQTAAKNRQPSAPSEDAATARDLALLDADEVKGDADDADADADADDEVRVFGMLAKRYCNKDLPLEICYSARGFYIGTCEDGLPCSRESQEYWVRREQATKALESGDWTQKPDV